VIYKLDSTGKETVLYSFAGPPIDGANPNSGLVRDLAGNLYGTTQFGGVSNNGVVFKLDSAGNEAVLHSFEGAPSDGGLPCAGLLRDLAGNLYGTTYQGGALGMGVVFKLDSTGKETVTHSFAGSPADGARPCAVLIRDFWGNLYGSAQTGGANNGVAFKLDPAGKLTVLHSFMGYPTDGSSPWAGLIRDFAGNFYGTTIFAGASNNGVVFKLDATGKETVLHSFAGGPADGSQSLAGLLRDLAGNLYGTTALGGAGNAGVVFKLDSTGRETVLHNFGGPDGAGPYDGLISVGGSFYGTTQNGGTSDLGVVFRLRP
jgi:uncharacterized repeat protein (TIGR03803 family)